MISYSHTATRSHRFLCTLTTDLRVSLLIPLLVAARVRQLMQHISMGNVCIRLCEWERCWIQQHTKILLLLRYAGQMYECVRLLVNRFDDISSTDLNGGGLVARCRLSFYCKQKNNRTTWFVMLSGSFEWPFVDLSLNWVYRTVSLFKHIIFAKWIGNLFERACNYHWNKWCGDWFIFDQKDVMNTSGFG